ncbi:MAG: mannose-1-phosphate guanylyltransferase [Candidatus Omnitrophica bacterium]|nr:mannose-1-phosphate guanylyltransferase [Candidatus Omnitrophota bacterium]
MLWAVIMAGGSGTRFWPESREKKPKQFIPLFGKKTLFENTITRLQPIIKRSRIFVITQDFLAAAASRAGKISPGHVIGEPVGRNTAPCAILSAAMAVRKDPEAVVALLPSDHRIGKENVFRQALQTAHHIAMRERFPVTFGIKPTYPHTGYGYLELDDLWKKEGDFEVFRLKNFCEKPSLSIAKKFFDSGQFLWNSGMFVWRADALLEAARHFLPEAHDLALEIASTPGFKSAMKNLFPKMPNISIDYGLMEKLKGKILTMPLDLDWNDLGGWQSFSELWPRDEADNMSKGNTVFVRSSGNTVKAGKRLVALLNVKDLFVIDTEDALLICSKDSTESVKEVVKVIREKKLEKFL